MDFHANMGINVQAFKTLIDSHESSDWLTLWPRVKTLYWTTPPEYLQFLKYFLTPGVRNLKINLEWTEDEEFQEVLGLVESRCMNLEDLRLFDSATRENEDIQNTIRQIIYNNSLTLRLFYPPQDPSAPLVNDILQLPALQVLEMHIPQIPYPIPSDILPSLEYLDFTLDGPSDIIELLGTLGESKLRQFTLICPYPTSEDDQAALAEFFDDSGLYDTVDTFSWVPPPDEEAPTWEFVTILGPFANMQTLVLDGPCDHVCRFGFRHDHIVELSGWMPQLIELSLGGSPCPLGGLMTDIGYHTLATLVRNCPNLSLLATHFNINTFILPAGYAEPSWKVAFWDVGNTALPSGPQYHTLIALAVSKLFPKATFIGTTGEVAKKWSTIHEELRMFTLPAVHGLPDLM